MIIKLALSDNKLLWPDIKKCCIENKSSFIPIYGNIFGIASNLIGYLGFGQSSLDTDDQVDNLSFINVYQCLKLKMYTDNKKRINNFFFRSKRIKPQNLTLYSSLELDNQYFINLVNYCIHEKYILKEIEIINQFDTIYKIRQNSEIVEYIRGFSSENLERIKALAIHYTNTDLFINKHGYIQIKKEPQDIDENLEISDEIRELLSVGFSNV